MNTRHMYNINGWQTTEFSTSSRLHDRTYYSPWDDEDSLVRRLKDIKWRFDGTSAPYREFVEVRNGKSPKLPDSYPKGDLADLLGFGEVD